MSQKQNEKYVRFDIDAKQPVVIKIENKTKKAVQIVGVGFFR